MTAKIINFLKLPGFKDVEQPQIEQVVETFNKWLALGNPTSLYAMLGTVAANLLPGDPVWLGLIAPSSTAKTELLNSISQLPYVVSATTLSPAALLSGTPKPQMEKGAKGGLLCQIGAFGILALKDFGSILQMRHEARGETLAALRHIYDGEYPRSLGTGGGRTYLWKGKLGLVFCATEHYDQHHAVISMLGDRFLLCRPQLASSARQFDMALKHAGTATATMRSELATVVNQLFAQQLCKPQPLSVNEHAQLRDIVVLATRLRGSVVRHSHTRELEQAYGEEGPGRLALSLEQLLAGLDAIGLERPRAWEVIEHVAMSSTPSIRWRTYKALLQDEALTTSAVADRLRLPINTARRALEELHAYRLVMRTKGRVDVWQRVEP